MKKQETVNSANVAHCPICNANAVEPCQQPKKDDCPRGDERKTA